MNDEPVDEIGVFNFQSAPLEENRPWGLFCAVLASGLSGLGSGITETRARVENLELQGVGH